MTEPRSLTDYLDPETVEEWRQQVTEAQSRLPVFTDADAMLDWLVDRGQLLSVDEWNTAGSRIGRNSTPWLLVMLHVAGLLAPETLSYAVPDAWNLADSPLNVVSRNDWLVLFGEAGFTVDGVRSERPAESVRLYRGCRPEHRRRWSWTPDPILAHWFADRPQVNGVVYEALVSPKAILATFTPSSHAFRNESESVVVTTGLKIAEHICSCETGPAR